MGETLKTLGIYWPKLVAQLINFAIVLFVLWKFAYRPVLAVLAQRRELIEEGMKNAARIKAELARTEADRQQVLDQATAQANKLIEEGRTAAARVREQEIQKAIAEAAQIITKAREEAVATHARMLMELRREVGRLVVDTTSKVTGKVLTPEDQRRLAEETSRQLAA
jgi:F-type H+-transporting ATPase subunit b